MIWFSGSIETDFSTLPGIEPGKKQPSGYSDLEARVPLVYDSRIRIQIQPCDTESQRACMQSAGLQGDSPMTHMIRRTGFVILGSMLICGVIRGQQNVTVPLALVAYPDLIVYYGKIVTMDDAP